jgi:hypothetical protein
MLQPPLFCDGYAAPFEITALGLSTRILTQNSQKDRPQAPETAFLTGLVVESDFNPESSRMDSQISG